ncbi:MAG TPA: hypothetical protein VKF17_16180 [Isosphaeraceae bacterium]|nr:hypothetical protein [Isosphaeraceae bacterium]
MKSARTESLGTAIADRAGPSQGYAGVVGMAGIASAACVVLLLVATGPWLLTGRSIEEFGTVDRLYHSVATRMARGLVPYRDFELEYPVGCLPQLFLPILAGTSVRVYRLAYIAEMLVINALLLLALTWHVDRRAGRLEARRRLIWYLVSFLFLGRLIISRIDVITALLMYVAALSWAARKPILWGSLAALGGLVKIVPALVVLPASLGELARPRSTRLVGTITFAVCSAVGVSLWYLLGHSGMVNAIRYHAERVLEIESVAAGLLMLLGRLGGEPFGVQWGHGCYEVVSSLSPALLAASRYIQLALLGISLIPLARSGSDRGLQCCGALTLAFIVTAPVLSPQYLVWVLPLILSVGGSLGRRGRPLYVLACALTFLIYPVFFYRSLVPPRLPGILLLNARNLLLIGLWLLMCFGTTGPDGGERRGGNRDYITIESRPVGVPGVPGVDHPRLLGLKWLGLARKVGSRS